MTDRSEGEFIEEFIDFDDLENLENSSRMDLNMENEIKSLPEYISKQGDPLMEITENNRSLSKSCL